MNLSILFKQHYWAVVLACVVGMIMILPHIILLHELGDEYRGYAIAEVDSDDFYLARISAAYEGDYAITQATIKSNVKPKPFTSPPLAENFVALVAKILNLKPEQMVVVGNFLFPALLTLILYAIAWKLSESKLLALLTAAVVLISSNILFDPRQLLSLVSAPEGLFANAYLRPIHPQISSLFFYSWFLLFIHWLWQPRTWLLVVCGVTFGLLFYIYPYSWTLAACILGILFVISLIQKNSERAWRLVGIGIIGFAVSLFYWKNFWELLHHPMYEEMRKRFVILASRKPLWSDLLALDSFALLVIFWRKFSNKTILVLGAVISSLWLLINQQVISGIRLFPGHWHWYYVVPITTLILLLFVKFLTRRFPKIWYLFAVIVLSITIANGIVSQSTYAKKHLSPYKEYQRYMLAYEWLNKNISTGSVILSDFEFSKRLPVYTSHFRYAYQSTDELYLITREQMKSGYFTTLLFQGATFDNIGEYIRQDTLALREILLGYYRQYAEDCFQCYSEGELEQLRKEYVEFYNDDFETRLKQYPVDYVVTDGSKDAIINFESMEFLEAIVTVGDFKIYQVN